MEHIMHNYILLIILMLSPAANALTPEDYQFKLGHWNITAKAMQADQTYITGSGTGMVYLNNAGIIQDDLCIDMTDMADVVGSTFRTFNKQQQTWFITWVAYASAGNMGTATTYAEQATIKETFTGQDQHGAYNDEMTFTVQSKDQYTANLSRTYKNGGYHIDCIWCYEATRSTKPLDQSSCQLIK